MRTHFAAVAPTTPTASAPGLISISSDLAPRQEGRVNFGFMQKDACPDDAGNRDVTT